MLRPIREEDSEVIFTKWAKEPEITKYMTWRPHQSIQETKQHVSSFIDGWSENDYTWIIEVKETGEVIGSFAARQKQHKVDIGYLIIKSEWGNGYMTEVMVSAFNEIFKDKSVQRIWAVCDIENIGSKRVMEKSGMEYEGLLKSWLVHPNMGLKPRDCHCLSIINNV